MNIQAVVKKIIPPSDREHRDRFDNKIIIDQLSVHEKIKLKTFLL